MSKQIFLTEDEILELLIDELPDGVYPEDRADDANPEARSISSSELRAQARTLAQAQASLELVDADKHLTTVSAEGLAGWEKDYFAGAQDSSQPYAIRQQALLSQKRATGSISLPAIRSIIAGILDPIGVAFDIFPYSGQASGPVTGAWIFGVSELGVGTWLSELDPLQGKKKEFADLDCSQNYVAAGLTADQLAAIQRTAYTYEVRIYGNADAASLALLERRLTQKEPARSTHVIRNNAQLPGEADIAAYIAATPEFARMRPQEN